MNHLSCDELNIVLDEFYTKWSFDDENIFQRLKTIFLIQNMTNISNIQNNMKNEISKIMDLGFALNMKNMLHTEKNNLYQFVFKRAQNAKMYVENHYLFCGDLSVHQISTIFLKAPSTLEFENLSAFQKLIFHTLDTLCKNNMKRVGTDIYEEIKNPYPTKAWQKKCGILEFINQHFSIVNNYTLWLLLTSTKDIDKRVVDHLSKSSDDRFPELIKNRNVFSFKNGIYISHVKDENGQNTYTDKFVEYTSHDIVHVNETACKYFDINMDTRISNTPIFDSIFEYQHITTDNINVIKGFIGRMMYNIGDLDNWQTILMLIGSGGTGKSTIVNVVKKFYDNDDVGVISNNIQTTFGLSDIYNKYLYIAPEIKRDWKIDQAEFQEMISGGKININRKHHNSIMVEWNVPGIIAGNENPGFVDNAMSIQRRIVSSRFDVKIQNVDGNLSKKLDQELPTIMRLCNLHYLKYASLFGSNDIWSWIPEYFRDTQRLMTCATNTLEAFLESDGIRLHKDLYIPKNVFFKEYNIFCNQYNFTKNKITIDFYKAPFNKYGITLHKCKVKQYQAREYRDYTFIYGVDLNY